MNGHPIPARPPGLFAHGAAFFAATARYSRARLALAGLEAREAGTRYGLAAAMIAAALFVAVLGYVFLVITVVFAIAVAFDAPHAWLWLMAAAALLHLGGATALVWIAWSRVQAGAFPATLSEFRKDQQWLSLLANKN